MSIKTRLLLSYIAMTVVPVALFAVLAVGIAWAFINPSTGNGEGKIAEFWANANGRTEIVNAIKYIARTEPDHVADSLFLRQADEQLNELQAGLVMKRNDQLAYVSPLFNDHQNLISRLENATSDYSGPPWGNSSAAVSYNFTFSDGSAGSIYVLSDTNSQTSSVKLLFAVLVLSLLVVIGLTNGGLTFLVSRSMIKPLYALKKAADTIKEGDLDTPVNMSRRDEIGKLALSFEDMRIRLKESIHLQLQYEDNRKELISNISHDLKTPITGIKACIEGIQDGIANTAEKRDKYIGMIAQKTDEMDRLIDELLLFSKLDMKRLPFHIETVDLSEYLREYVEQLRLEPGADGVQIVYAPGQGRPIPVLADRDKLRRAMMNIIENSLKYMDKERKEIRIELFDDQSEVTVHIRDNGPGIESAALLHIFDRFYRAEQSRNTSTGGSGLGLAIVKQIMEGQGGRVWAESEAGQGTSLYFTLPKPIVGGERA
ncbi:MAG: histidine kinase [Paenibacillus sp.]|nr:histidine kinase [Paenibacillus sp.]